jgi:hypothetical protein
VWARFSKGSPHHGAGAIDLVSGDRLQPAKFVPGIYQATAADFVLATQRVYCSPKLPSHIVLPVIQ